MTTYTSAIRPSQLLTAGQVAERLQVSAGTVRKLCAQRDIRAVRVGAQWRIAETEIARCLAAGGTGGGAREAHWPIPS